jgi:hypothetical protein
LSRLGRCHGEQQRNHVVAHRVGVDDQRVHRGGVGGVRCGRGDAGGHQEGESREKERGKIGFPARREGHELASLKREKRAVKTSLPEHFASAA